MISYAVSLASFGKFMTSELADAFRQSKLRNVELSFQPYTDQNEQSRISGELTRQLISEGVIRAASVHLPFQKMNWDPSELDEARRREIVANFMRIIRDNAGLMAPFITLHASGGEPLLDEHSARLDQTCRSIGELLPLADEMKFSINVELLPRTCIGNCVEELQTIVRRFDPEHVGICLDVNHVMDRSNELPGIIKELSPWIRTFHINDYDGIDEMHWFPGQGIIDWPAVMRAIRTIDHDVLLIHETVFQLCSNPGRPTSPIFGLRQTEASCWFLENCDRIIPAIQGFEIPGNI